ncbi:MAG: cytochrome c biogenesis protein ResB [Alphaproteobacteria bacterium]|nr:cytochrome c biogenesis protein ResB [Alphaproteobacteria bacterium]
MREFLTWSYLHKTLLRLGRADIVFYLLPLLMLNLIAGTLAQRWLGLYAAQEMFFSAFITWIGPVPLPGGYTLLGVFCMSLLIKFLFASPWQKGKTGIVLAHLGALVLMIGGLVTALSAREHFMVIAQGQSSPYIYDYHKRALFIFAHDDLIRTVAFKDLAPKKKIEDLPFSLTILKRCMNCAIERRPTDDAKNFKSMGQFMMLQDKPPEKEPEANISGITLRIDAAKRNQNGDYIAFDGMPKPIAVNAGGRAFKLMFGKEQSALPFSIRLDKFTKEVYPGTDQASGYSSDVVVEDGVLKLPARISMNAPLHYRGYTFYQSSFEQGPQGTASILSVVHNKGRIFPYLGTAIMAVGLLLHIYLQPRSKVRL